MPRCRPTLWPDSCAWPIVLPVTGRSDHSVQRVWLVDDCPVSTRFMRVRLLTLGADVSVHSSGQAAVAAFVAGVSTPEFVLMDLHMPGTDGLESGRLLRDAGYTGALIIHTTEITPEIRAATKAAGFDGFLQKPATKDDMARLLGRPPVRRAG